MPGEDPATRPDDRSAPRGLGLYVHVPFCAKRCPYCDFNAQAGLDGWQAAYVDALCVEMDVWSGALRARPITSVYVGGGTPTWLGLGLLERILDHLAATFALTPDCEITVEANPGTVAATRLANIRALGVSRLSLGAQSFREEELRFLGRIHGPADIRRSFAAARDAGFDNVSLDVIFALPGQRRADWDTTLDEVLALEPEHVSAYQLTVEEGTPLQRLVATGLVLPTSSDRSARLFEHAMERLTAAGYTHYEVSSWARAGRGPVMIPSTACRHNLLYWRNGAYIGVGAGAHSHVHVAEGPDGSFGLRWANVLAVVDYVERVKPGSDPGAWHERVEDTTAMGETMMLGLRLLQEGVLHARFHDLHRVDPRQVFASELDDLRRLGLVRVTETAITLTRRGLMLGNQVFARFLP